MSRETAHSDEPRKDSVSVSPEKSELYRESRKVTVKLSKIRERSLLEIAPSPLSAHDAADTGTVKAEEPPSPMVTEAGNPKYLSLTPVPAPDSIHVSQETTHAAVLSQGRRSGVMPKGIPVLHCSVCSIGPECPEYSEGYVCAFEKPFREVPTRDLNDIADLMAGTLQENVLRFRRARLLEDIVMGGQIDSGTTSLSETVMSQAKQLSDIVRSTQRVSLTAQGEGILTKVFGHLAKGTQQTLSASDPQTVLDVPYEVVGEDQEVKQDSQGGEHSSERKAPVLVGAQPPAPKNGF